ncbi:serine/threonine protein phosphatase [Methylobacterium sp. J-078]|uniref:metallophosphoesterase family protein n=1 Tax=Methylobacterium sp. J-078 TaxID=2836657 RepID=UPI001FBAC38C|nr:metallophosphoesterase family protein [Methylobacterium sp. J-078]MCJ2044003.1 serine/threonine protein phosphatase [Methylobacterium sp. J-078]
MSDLTYAIGDIHGCADALTRLLDQIDAHARGRAAAIVCLGDYVDRGPDSAGVIGILRARQAASPGTMICLRGNHEQMMLDAHRDAHDAPAWLANGGIETLRSFGVTDPEAMPHEVLAWISGLPTVHEDARRYYVHAGFRPGCRGIDPDVTARLWIREPFLGTAFDFGKHVVHGHTPQRSGQPDVRSFRTNLDTACVYGRVLTAGIFTMASSGPVEFLYAPRDAEPPSDRSGRP